MPRDSSSQVYSRVTPSESQQLDAVLDVMDFSGGLNTRGSNLLLGRGTPYCLRKNQLTELTNMDMLSSGQLITRWGYTKVNASAIVPPLGTQEIQSVFELRQKDGDKYILVNVGNSIYVWNSGTSTFDSLGTVTNINERFHWTQFTDLAIGVSLTNAPVKFNGAVLAALGGSPPSGGTCITAYRNRVMIGKGLSIYYSNDGAPEDWTTNPGAGVLPIPSLMSTRVTALIPFYTRLIILTDSEVFELTGSGPSDFAINLVTSVYGNEGTAEGVCISGNDGYWVSTKGVHKLQVTEANANLGYLAEYDASALILPTWLALNSSNLANRVMIDVKQKNQFIVLCSDSATQNTMALVADYYHKDELGRPAWSIYTNFAFSSACEVMSLNSKREVVFGDYNGFVHRYNDCLNDNGVVIPIAWTYVTDMDLVTWYKTWRHLVMYAKVAQGATLLMTAGYDFGAQAINASVTLSATSGHTLGVDWVLGTDPLGYDSFLTKRIPIPGSGRFGSFRFTGSPANRVTIGGMLFYAGKRRVILG